MLNVKNMKKKKKRILFEWNSKWTTIFNTGVFSLSLATLDILVKNHIIGIAVLPIYMEGDF